MVISMSDSELIEYIEQTGHTYESWLSLMRFGQPTLIARSQLAIELVVREAERARSGAPRTHTVADRTVDIMTALGWKISVV
jgi:hypothetical protein